MEKPASSSSISDCVLTRTARIQSLSIRAFKSFSADVQTFNFSTGLNLVVGANGSGKSNILDAICFVLCSKTSALRVKSVSELQSADTKEPCEVSLDLQILGTSGNECDLINLSVRILPNDVRQYKLNGKLKSLKEVKDFLKEHRLFLDETSAVVHQSSVTELADKNSSLKLASIISAASGAGGNGGSRVREILSVSSFCSSPFCQLVVHWQGPKNAPASLSRVVFPHANSSSISKIAMN